MPFVHIALRRGQSREFLEALSAGIHRAMTEAFDVPVDYLFHAIHQHEEHELFFDRRYMGGPRSEGWVLLNITAGRPRSTQTKRRFYRRLAECLVESPGIEPGDIMVIINATQPEDWSFGNGIAAIDVPPSRA
jgi:phenylpyruvate tautomerase PptA (4-oxalocrotonate tautomerase family)